jgi:NAD-dependent dihydropyrimidine dehydrogenase PreA subunit
MNGDLGLAQKCTGCAHRVDEGALPRCAEVCPHDVIRIGDDADSLQSDVVPDKPLEVYHPEYHAEPRVYWKGLPTPWIAGVVIDPVRDEVISGAEVTAIDLFEEGSFTVLSDAFGDFWMRGMKENWRYRVEIRKEGYEDVIDIVVTNGDQDLGTVCLKRTS